MDGDEDDAGDVLGERQRGPVAGLRQQVVRLVDHQPVRPAGLRPQAGEVGHELGEEGGPLVQPEAERVDDHVRAGIGKQPEDLLLLRRRRAAADRDGVAEVLVVAFGIEDAELEASSP